MKKIKKIKQGQWHKWCFLAQQDQKNDDDDDDGEEVFLKKIFPMQSSGGDVAATHSLSPSGFIREGQKSQPCRDDGLRVTAAMSQQEASRLGALGPRRACCCCLGRGRVAAAGEEGVGGGV